MAQETKEYLFIKLLDFHIMLLNLYQDLYMLRNNKTKSIILVVSKSRY
jgi:hypothetical protein